MKQSRKHFSKLGLVYLAGSLLIYGVQLLAGMLADAAAPALFQNDSIYFLSVMLPMYAIAMPLMGLLIRTLPAEKVPEHRMTAVQWLTAFVMCYGIMYAGNLAGTLLTGVIGAIKGSGVENVAAEAAVSVDSWVRILVMVLLAPVAEEILFRKLLIDRTVKYGEGIAVVFSGLMFGLFHGNLNQFAYAFLIGMFLGYIYVKTGRLLYTILMHMLINFLGSVVSVWVMEASGYNEIMAKMGGPGQMAALADQFPRLIIFFSYAGMVLLLAAAGIILFIVCRKRFVCCPGEAAVPKGKRFSVMFMNIGMLLYTLFWLGMILWQLFL